MKPPTQAAIEAALTKPTNRALYTVLLRSDEPLRSTAARESAGLSIARFGLAIRALERMGLAQTRHIAKEGTPSRLLPAYVELTDAGREYERLLVIIDRRAAMPNPAAGTTPTMPTPPTAPATPAAPDEGPRVAMGA